MPVFRLSDACLFPPPELASPEGILAVGGDLSPERLVLAYRMGIFPWYGGDDPILWWSPDPRFVLFPDELKVSRSMRQLLKKEVFRITYDRNFQDVIAGCRAPGKDRGETWIHDDMMAAYEKLHALGYAHSVEAWRDGQLAGGLYGVSLGRCFFGESMFTRVSNASKAALITLTRHLRHLGFVLIDCQVYSDHLLRLGARMIPRTCFLALLDRAMTDETFRGDWGRMPAFDARSVL